MDHRENSDIDEPFLPEEVIEIRREAEESYHGPFWVRFAVGATMLFSVGAIGFGVMTPHSVPAHTKHSGGTRILPSTPTIDIGDLPMTLAAHFKLTSTEAIEPHVSVANHTLYVAQLNQPLNEWPTISLSAASFAESGETYVRAAHAAGKVELVPPISSGGGNKGGDSVNWGVKDWHIWAMNSWIIASVEWTGTKQRGNEYQLYALYLPTEKYSMFRTLTAPNDTTSFRIAAGDGKVVIVGNPTSRAKGSASYPIEVDDIGGSNPLQPIVDTHYVTIGVPVSDPLVRTDSMLFQSNTAVTKGMPEDITWYRTTWQGELQTLSSYPADGYADLGVVGSTGNMYVVEEIPSSAMPSRNVVRISPLVPGGQGPNNQSMALPSLVRSLFVTQGYLVWTQQVNHKWMLVLGAVN